MLKFTINKKPYSISTDWEDLTFKQYLDSFHVKHQLGAIAILTGMDEDILKKATILGADKLIEATKFIWREPKFKDSYPKIGPYPTPVNKKGSFDIQIESLGQFEDMRVIMMSQPATEDKIQKARDIAAKYPKYIAIYLQKVRDGEYDYQKAMEMSEEIMTYPAGEVITLGSFFFVRLISLLPGTGATSPSTPPTLKNLKAASKPSKKCSGHTRQSRRSR